jgi:tetratricopeptide (TPR) repeat protein
MVAPRLPGAFAAPRLVPCIFFSFFLSIPGLAQSQTPPNATTAAAVDAIKIAYQRGDFDTAVSVAERAVADSPNDALLQLWLGRAYGRKAQAATVFSRIPLARKCRTAFERAVALDPSSVDARFDLLSYHMQAPGIAGGDKNVARQQAGEILKLDTVRGHWALAWIAEKDKDAARAESEFRKAFEADASGGRVADTHWRLARFYERAGRKGDAKAELREALKLNPEHAQAKKDLKRLEG